jgi:pantetheine-phosphate adenylyltransferase
VEVVPFEGLLVGFARQVGAGVIIRGLRAVSDFDYEFQMAQMNSTLGGVETVFVPTAPAWSFLASSLVKEVAALGGDVEHLLPAAVNRQLIERLARPVEG